MNTVCNKSHTLHLLLLSLLLATTFFTSRAEGTENSTRRWKISILTCGPGQSVYELYGHTALRIKNVETDYDMVFNYGMFSFNRPHFVSRFVRGETDYWLGAIPFEAFLTAYRSDRRSVSEQILNLTHAEKERLCRRIDSIMSQKGWTYRYNFLYDNCTTRVIDDIESCMEGRVVWPVSKEKRTYRDIIHQYAAVSPWYSFGQDLLLGTEVDRPLDTRRQMFAPLYAERYLREARIVAPDGTTHPLVLDENIPLDDAHLRPGTPLPWPLLTMSLLLLLAIATAIREYRRGSVCWQFDALLMTIQGLTGCIVTFLFFGSAHPAVDSNWLILLLNPLPLLWLPVRIWRIRHGKRDCYYDVMGISAGIVLLAGIFGIQQFPAAIYPLALILIIRGNLFHQWPGYLLPAQRT